VGSRAGLDRCRKSHPPPGFNPLIVQSIVSYCTGDAIPVYSEIIRKEEKPARS
jgi:hypothetical protein